MPEENPRRANPQARARNTGDAPRLGRVSRSPLSGVHSSPGTGSRGSSRSRTKVLAGSILLSLLSLAVLAAFTAAWLIRETPAKPAASEPSPPAGSPALREPLKSSATELSLDAASALVRQALENKDPALMSRFILSGKTPQEAFDTLAALHREEGPIRDLQPMGGKFTNGRMMEEVVVNIDGPDGKPYNRLAQLLPAADGSWRIDFDSYIRASSPDWDTILSGASPLSTVRVFITPDNYYNGAFTDDSAWTAYALVTPDSEDILYGYARTGSPQQAALSRILAAEESFFRTTLQLRKTKGAGKRQFEISRVLAENWVIGETPFDESF